MQTTFQSIRINTKLHSGYDQFVDKLESTSQSLTQRILKI